MGKVNLKEKYGLMGRASELMASVDSDKRMRETEENISRSKNTMKEHKKQLQRLEEKDPEFYQFLKEHDKELLEFDDEDIDDDTDGVSEIEPLDEDTDIDKVTGFDDVEPKLSKAEGDAAPRKVITSEMVEIWCEKINNNKQLKAVRSLLRAFRTACHHGDNENEYLESFSIVSSSVFNKIMLFVMNEMDEILRGLLQFPRSGGKKETIMELTTTGAWKKFGILMKIYLSNALHVLNQMTDEQMIAFTLKRIKDSAVFLGAFPALLRKYLKVVLHFWSIGGGALQVVSFLFVRDLCVRLGEDCLEMCLRGIYKAYASVCKIKGKYAGVSKLGHLRFLENCVTELYGVDLSNAYQHAFICIRQLATILRNALSEKPKGKKEGGGGKKEKKTMKARKKSEVESTMNKKGAYLKVYDWQFINCLELWTTVICAHSSDADFQHLAYPLTQIIFGVARLVPTARYLPIRLQCARMLNRLGASTKTFIPVSLLLLDVLEMKELTNPPTGGVGKAVDLFTRKLVGKPTLKTRAFQEACIFSVVEQLAEHLTQWSYSVAFFELSFLTVIRLRSFCKVCRFDLFRKEIKELIRQVEANSEFSNARRESVQFSPSDATVSSFLKAEKVSGSSPLSQFATELKKKARQRSNSMVKSSVIVGAKFSKFSDSLPEFKEEGDDYDDIDIGEDENEDPEEGTAVFSTSWLPDPKAGLAKSKLQQKQTEGKDMANVGADEDVVEDLVLSSDDDEPAVSGSFSDEEDDAHQLSSSAGESKKRKPSFAAEKQGASAGENKKRKLASAPSKKKWRPLEKKKSKKNNYKKTNSRAVEKNETGK